MKYFTIIIPLFLLTTQKKLFFRDQFTGCNIDLFPNPFNFVAIQINFSLSCTNLENCAKNYKISRLDCLSNFKKDMLDFCAEYSQMIFRGNGRYCQKLAITNFSIAFDLEKDLFNFAEFKFKANIADDINNNANDCLQIGSTGSVRCKYGNIRQIFKFYFIEKLDKWIIQNFEEDKCLNASLAFDECDFDNEENFFSMLFDQVNGNFDSSVDISNSSGKFLNLDTSGNGFEDDQDGIYIILADD